MTDRDPMNQRIAVMVSSVIEHLDWQLTRIDNQLNLLKDYGPAFQTEVARLTGQRQVISDIWDYFWYDQDKLSFNLDEQGL